MNIRDVRNGRYSPKPGARAQAPCSVSRRQFVRGMAGAAVLGATLGSGIWRPSVAQAHGTGDPVSPTPIPGGSPALGGGFHVFGPVLLDPIDAEPATITDFNGTVGLAYISGSVKRTNNKTGEVRTLPFVESDMRFMKGDYRGQDGKMHQGAFSLV